MKEPSSLHHFPEQFLIIFTTFFPAIFLTLCHKVCCRSLVLFSSGGSTAPPSYFPLTLPLIRSPIPPIHLSFRCVPLAFPQVSFCFLALSLPPSFYCFHAALGQRGVHQNHIKSGREGGIRGPDEERDIKRF